MYGLKRPDIFSGLPGEDETEVRRGILPDPLYDARDAERKIRALGQNLRNADLTGPLDIGSPPTPGEGVQVAQAGQARSTVSDADFFKPIILGNTSASQPSPATPPQGGPQASAPTASAAGDFFAPISFGAQASSAVKSPEEEGWFSGIGGALVKGTQQTGSSIVAGSSAIAGSESGVLSSTQFSTELEQNSQLQALNRLKADIEEDKKKYAGQGGLSEVWSSVKNVAGNMIANPKGAAEFIAEQAPNAVAALGAGFLGAKGGAVTGTLLAGPGYGTAGGAVVGFLTGLFGANTLLETGGKAQERARDGNFTAQDRREAVSEGVTKGAVITGVDAATLGASRWLLGTTSRAVESATARVLERNGIDAAKATQEVTGASQQALRAAQGLDPVAGRQLVEESMVRALANNGLTKPTLIREIRDAQVNAFNISNSFARKFGRGSGAMALETLGEGVGEYLGEYAATGKADITDAVMESIAGLTMSAGELVTAGKTVVDGKLTRATNLAGVNPPAPPSGQQTSGPDGGTTPPAGSVAGDGGIDDTPLTPTNITRGMGLAGTQFERTLETDRGQNLLGALWANGDADQRTIINRVLERSGKLDLVQTLGLTDTDSALANPRVAEGVQTISDMPTFGRDFYRAAVNYANTQPAALTIPKKDKRPEAPELQGVDAQTEGTMTPEEIQAMNQQAENVRADAQTRLSRANIDLNNVDPTNLSEDEIDAINDLAAQVNSERRNRGSAPLVKMNADGEPLTASQSAMSSEVERLVDSGADSQTVLQAIANNPNASEFEKDLAAKLSGLKINPKISFANLFNNGNQIGLFQLAPNRILMDRDNGGNLTQLFLHEYIHALTLSSRLAETKVGREMIALFNKYKKVQGERTDYGFDTVDEFFSEALSNPEFQKYLMTLKVDGIVGQFWNRIVEIFQKLFGVKNKGLMERMLDITYRAAAESSGTRDRLLSERNIEDVSAPMAARGSALERDVAQRKPVQFTEKDSEGKEFLVDPTPEQTEFLSSNNYQRVAKGRFAPVVGERVTPASNVQPRQPDDVDALADRIRLTGLSMRVPDKLVDATLAKSRTNPNSKQALIEFADAIESFSTAQAEYNEAINNEDVREIKDASAALHVAEREGAGVDEAKARFDEAIVKRPELIARYRTAKGAFDQARARYNSAIGKLDGGKEAEKLPKKYEDRDLERASSEREPKYSSQAEARAFADRDMKDAQAKRTALRQKFIDQLVSGDIAAAFQTWNEYYPINPQTFVENDKGEMVAKTAVPKRKYEQQRYNDLIAAMRWVYGQTKNPGIRAMLDASWRKKEAFEAQRKSFTHNMATNGMFAAVIDLAINQVKSGLAKLGAKPTDLLNLPSVREYTDRLTDRQVALLRTMFGQITLADLRAYYDAKYWDGRRQGDLDITTDAANALKDYQTALDEALNSMYRADREFETIDQDTGEIKSYGKYDDVLNQMRQQQAELIALANAHSRGSSDEAGYLIAMMSPQREGFQIDRNTMTSAPTGSNAIETRYAFDPDNVDRGALTQMAAELGVEIREMEVNRLRNKGKAFQKYGHHIFQALAKANIEALRKGLPNQMVMDMFIQSVKTLRVGLGVKLNQNVLSMAFPNDPSAVEEILRPEPQERPEEDLTIAQDQLFTDSDFAVPDQVAALKSLVKDVKEGRMTPDEAANEIIKAYRDEGGISASVLREEFAVEGIAAPMDLIQAVTTLPYRKRLRDHLTEHGGDRVYFHEWMSHVERLDKAGKLNEVVLTKFEIQAYKEWIKDKSRLQSRLSRASAQEEMNSAFWVFSDLLFANYSLEEMRDLKKIEDKDKRNLIRSLFSDPVNQWHKDVEHARQMRPDLFDQVLNPASDTMAMVSQADAIDHLNWMSLRKSVAERDVRVANDIKQVEGLMETVLADFPYLDAERLNDRSYEETRYYIPKTESTVDNIDSPLAKLDEVDADTPGARPIRRQVNVPGLRTILYRTIPAEREAVMQNWLRLNNITFGERENRSDEEIQGLNDEFLEQAEQEDLYRAKTEMQFQKEAVDSAFDDQQTDSSLSDYEQYLADMESENTWSEDDADGSPIDSDRLRQGAYSGVVSAAVLQEWVNRTTSKWKGAPHIQVMSSYLQLPEPLLSSVQSKLSDGMGAKGLYDGNTHTVYMFADHITGEADAEFTLFHEVFGHFGMRGVLGSEFDSFLNSQYASNAKVRSAADALIESGTPKLEAIDEVLSDMTVATEAPGAFKQYVGKVLTGLRKIGLGKVADWFGFLSDAELAYVLEASKRSVKDGTMSMQAAPDVIRMATQRNPYEMFAVGNNGKTKAYARYNPLINEWYVFTATGDDIRSGAYTAYSSPDYQIVLRDLQRLGKVESRVRSARFIDNKIPADFVKFSKFGDLKGWRRRARLARVSMQNEYATVWNLVEELVAQGRMSKNFDIKTALTLYERKTAVQVENYNRKFVEPVIEALERLRKNPNIAFPSFQINGESITNINDLVNLFLVAEHAKERNKQIQSIGGMANGSGMSNRDADKLLSFVRSQPYFSELNQISQKLDQLSQFKVDLEVQSGLISQKDATARMGAYQHYRNLSGVRPELDEDASQDPSLNIGRKFNLRGTDKRAMGRGDVAPDVLARTLIAGEASVIRAQKNLVAQKVLMLFETNYDPNFVTINEIRSARQVNRTTNLIEVNDDPNYLRRPDVMIAKVNGIPIAIRFKEQGKGTVAEALHGAVVPKDAHPVFEAMGKYNRFFGQLLTTYNPAWIAVNFVRDYQTLISNAVSDGRLRPGMAREMAKAVFPAMRAAIHIALHEFKPKTAPGKLALAGIKQFFRLFGKPDPMWYQSYKEAREAGGLTFFIDRKGLEEQIIDIDRALNGEHGTDKAMQRVKGFLSFVELMSIPTELAPRIAAYHVMRKHGFTKDQSAVFSGEITVNFNMRGATPELRQMYLFFNPAVQGTAKMVKLAAANPARFSAVIAAWTGLGLLINIFGRAMAGEDDDGINKMDKLPPLKRATGAVWMPDGLFGAVPIAYGYNAFYALGHFLPDSIVGNTPISTTARRVASTVFEAFSPIGNGAFEHKSPVATALKLTMPTFSHPLIEWIANENRFGAPIFKSDSPFGGPKDPDTYKNFDSANPISVATFRTIHEMTGGNRFNRDGVDINPSVADFFVAGYAPGVINETYKFAGWLVNKSRGVETQNDKLPIVGRFQADVPDQWYDGAYRKVKAEVLEREREIMRQPNVDRQNALDKKYPGTIEAAAVIEGVDRIVRANSGVLERARNNEDYKPSDIVEMENRHKKENRALYERAVKDFMKLGYRDTILSDK